MTETKQPKNLLGVKERIKTAYVDYESVLLDELGIEFENKIVELPITTLRRPNYSCRKQIENKTKAIEDSLNYNGFVGAIIIEQDSFNVIDGWHRLEIWRRLGRKNIPCIKVVADINQQKALHLKLNTQVAVFDFTEFGLDFQGLNLIDDFGFSEADIKPITVPEKQFHEKSPKPIPEGATKLSTTIATEAYNRLKAFKDERKLKHIGDAIEMLIDMNL